MAQLGLTPEGPIRKGGTGGGFACARNVGDCVQMLFCCSFLSCSGWKFDKFISVIDFGHPVISLAALGLFFGT